MNIMVIAQVLSQRILRYRSRENTVRSQEKALRKLIRYAYFNSPYYHRIYSLAGVTEDNIDEFPISALPTIDKNILMDNFSDILTVKDPFTQDDLREFDSRGEGGLFRGEYTVVHSSGSTGVPKYFVYDRKAWNRTTVGAMHNLILSIPVYRQIGMLFRGIRLMFVGADGSFGGSKIVGSCMDTVGSASCTVDINEPLENWGKRFLEFKPTIVIGYPTALRIMAEQVKGKVKKSSIDAVLSSGEPLSTSNRNYLSDVFGAKVVNFYAASESLALGADMGDGGLVYLPDHQNRFEIIDGALYLTNLTNYAQPLIRYRLTDCLELVSDRKDARLPFTCCNIIKGRDDDIFWLEDENGKKEFLHPLTMEDFCIPGLLDYQIRQTSRSSFTVDVQLEITCDSTYVISELERQINEILTQHRLFFVTFEIMRIGRILPDRKTGKKRLAVPL